MTHLHNYSILVLKYKRNAPLLACSCGHKHGRTCSVCSTSSPCFPPLGSRLATGKNGEKAHSTSDSRSSGKKVKVKIRKGPTFILLQIMKFDPSTSEL